MYTFYSDCVGWSPEDVHTEGGLCDLIDNIQHITRRTFLKYVDRKELKTIETQLGYSRHNSQGLTMSADWHVSYFKSTLHGDLVYGFQWSGIEFVFIEEA